MGLRKRGPGYRYNIAGANETWTLIFSWFFSSVFFGIFTYGARAVQFNSPIPGFELAPAVITAIAFAAALYMNKKVTGGFVYHMHLVATLFVGWLWYIFARSETRTRMYASANVEWTNTSWWRVFIASVSMVVAYFASALLVLAFVGVDRLVFVPQSPGVYPGFDTLADPSQAFAAELIFTALLGWLMTYQALTEGKSAHKGHTTNIVIAAILLAGGIWLTFNISGSAFDLAMWVVAHLVVGAFRNSGFTPFDAIPYGVFGDYWYVYVFGPLAGWVVGVALGYLHKYVDVEIDYAKDMKAKAKLKAEATAEVAAEAEAEAEGAARGMDTVADYTPPKAPTASSGRRADVAANFQSVHAALYGSKV